MADDIPNAGAAAPKQRVVGRPFVKGVSGNPAGRATGRCKVLEALDRIGEEAATDVLNKAIELARAGDGRSIELLMSRLWAPRRGRAIPFTLPKIESLADLPGAHTAVLDAVSAGEISAEEGQVVAGLLETHMRILETTDLAQQVEAMRAELAAMKARQS
jgi:hypothetical protein